MGLVGSLMVTMNAGEVVLPCGMGPVLAGNNCHGHAGAMVEFDIECQSPKRDEQTTGTALDG